MRILFAFFLLVSSHLTVAQYCIPTYSQPCTGGIGPNGIPLPDALIKSVWTTGGTTNISHLNTFCDPSINYDSTGGAHETIAGATIGINILGQDFLGPSPPPAIAPIRFDVWVDWNKDFIFSNNELVFTVPNLSIVVQSGSFQVPFNISPGDYAMRVMGNQGSPTPTPTSCVNLSYGETEDYTITILPTTNQEITICIGDTATFNYGALIPPNTTSVSLSPVLNSQTNFPEIKLWPTDTSSYQIIWTSPDSSWIDSIHVNVNPLLQPTFAGLDDTICQPNLIMLNATLANSGTSVFWSTSGPAGQIAFVPNNLALNPLVAADTAGVYEILLTEAYTAFVCPTISDTVTITFSQEFHITDSINPSCFNSSDGSITITSSGILGAVEYSIDNGTAWSNDSIFNNLTAGIYDVISRDEFGCSYSSQVTLLNPDKITVSASSDTTICENGNATLSANTTNGFFFNWDFTVSQGPIQSLSPIADSTALVFVTDSIGCSSDTITIDIALYSPISASITPNDTICPGESTIISIIPTGGLSGYDYSWEEDGIMTNWIDSTIIQELTTNTSYCITVTDQCESTPLTICTDIIMHSIPQISFNHVWIEQCEPNASLEFNITTPDDQFSTANLSFNNQSLLLTNTASNNPFTIYLEEAGLYDLSLEITSIHNCVNDTLISDYLEVNPIPDASFYLEPKTTSIYSPNFKAIILEENNTNSYTWQVPGGNPESSNSNSPQISFPIGVAKDYPITLVANSTAGCQSTFNSLAIVQDEIIIYAPNAFTPNSDSHNNTWKAEVSGIDRYTFHLQIFNRFGELVFESFNSESEWDGTLQNGLSVQSGTYVWTIKAIEIETEKIFDFNGTINLLK